MLKQTEIWNCPFCGKNTIQIIYFPKSMKTERGTWGGSKAKISMTNEKIIIQSGCSVCGKSKKEIDEYMNKRKEPSRQDVLKRLREAGLDPSKLK